MRKNLFGKVILIAMLLTMVLGVSVTQAQDTPSLEDMLERLQNSLDVTDTYESFVGTFNEVESQAIALNLAGFSQQQLSNTARTGEVRVIRGDNPNAAAFITVQVQESSGADELAYTVEAELRLVDGVLYVNAAYTEGENPSFPLTGTWETVDLTQLFLFPQFDVLDLSGLGELVVPEIEDEADTEGEEGEDAEPSSFDILKDILASATDISVEQTEQDGDTIDLFNITFGIEGLSSVFGAQGLDESNPVIPILLAELAEIDDLLNLTVGLDSDDNVRVLTIEMVVDLVDIDASQLDPSIPQGSTFSLSMGMLQSRTFDQINQVTERVEAP